MAIVHLGAKRLQGTKLDRVNDSLGSSADGTINGATLLGASETLKSTPDYSTDFSTTVSSNNKASDNSDWTTTDTYSITGGVLEGEGSQDEDPAGHGIYDLQNSNALGSGNNVNNNKWTLRMKIKWTGLSHTGEAKYAFIN